MSDERQAIDEYRSEVVLSSAVRRVLGKHVHRVILDEHEPCAGNTIADPATDPYELEAE